MERYTKNFTVAEMASKDGKDTEARMCQKFMEKLQALRSDFKKAMVVTSAIRSKEHNDAIGGAVRSMHLTRPCVAVDIDTSKWNSAQLYKFIDLVFEHGFTGIGIDKNFVHLDTRSKSNGKGPRLWTY